MANVGNDVSRVGKQRNSVSETVVETRDAMLLNSLRKIFDSRDEHFAYATMLPRVGKWRNI